jgi:hypothetical protein
MSLHKRLERLEDDQGAGPRSEVCRKHRARGS